MSQEVIDAISNLTTEQIKVLVVKALDLDMFDKEFTAGDYNGKEFANEMKYQGFDPQTIIAMILKTPEYNERDVYAMIQLCVGRGSNIDAMIKSSINKTKQKLEELKKKYSLVSSGKRSRYAITLPRVALVFPHITCSYAKITPDSTVSTDRMDQISSKYPRAMMCSAFAGLIPSGSLTFSMILRSAFMLWQYEFDSVINNKVYASKKPDKKRIVEDLLKYLNSAINGSLRFKGYDD